MRPVTREVVVLSGYTPKVPKSRVRQKLRDDGRIKSLQFTRIMTAEEACEVIRSGFKDEIQDFDEFKYLEIKMDNLELSSKQDLEVIDRRGALYICEKWTTVSINFIVTVVDYGTSKLLRRWHEDVVLYETGSGIDDVANVKWKGLFMEQIYLNMRLCHCVLGSY